MGLVRSESAIMPLLNNLTGTLLRRLRAHYYSTMDSSPQIQCGSVYLSYALIAFVVMIAGAILVPVHKDFALLLPIGILVFFMPNLIGLWARMQARGRYHRQLAAVRQDWSKSVVVLRNEFGGFEAQTAWLDLSQKTLGFLSGDKGSQVSSLATLRSVRAVGAEESQATSFHQGRVRVPARYILRFEFEGDDAFALVTMKLKRMRSWVEALRLHVGDRLDTRPLDGKL